MKRGQIGLSLTQIWILALTVASLQPARPGAVAGLHREIHWLAFAGATFLLLHRSRNRLGEILSMTATGGLGVALEYLQHVMYRNAMEWRDVRDDGIAIVAALALYRLAGRPKRPLQQDPARSDPPKPEIPGTSEARPVYLPTGCTHHVRQSHAEESLEQGPCGDRV